MKAIKSSVFQIKGFFYQACLFVGVITVLNYGHNFAQDNLNTFENQAKCASTKKFNPSYLDKFECSGLALLDLTKSVQETLGKAVR